MSKKEKVKTIAKSSVPIVVTVVDAFTQHFPVASAVRGVYDMTVQIKEDFQRQKIETFLKESGDVSQEDKEKLFKKLGKNQESFIRMMLLTIEKIDRQEKVKISGKLMKALFLEEITVEDFERTTIAVDKSYHDDLDFFYKYFEKSGIEIEAYRTKKGKDADPLDGLYSGFISHVDDQRRLHTLSLVGLTIANQINVPQLGMNQLLSTNYELSGIGRILLKYGY